MNTKSIWMPPNAAALGVSIPTRRMIRQDPLEEFARALGCRVDEMLLAAEPSRQHLLAMDFDFEEVTTAIAARRPRQPAYVRLAESGELAHRVRSSTRPFAVAICVQGVARDC